VRVVQQHRSWTAPLTSTSLPYKNQSSPFSTVSNISYVIQDNTQLVPETFEEPQVKRP